MERHLLPDEIDQLLDGEVGFETAPLKAHVRGCAECSQALDRARAVVRELEHLPPLRPSLAFSDRVMSRVQVFVPWHVALADWARGLVPQARGWRIVATAGMATAVRRRPAVSFWALTRLDAVLFVSEMLWDRLRAGAMSALASMVGALLGDGAAEAFRASGALGVGLLVAAFAGCALLAFGTVRAVSARSRAR